jgi:hypothetical protein
MISIIWIVHLLSTLRQGVENYLIIRASIARQERLTAGTDGVEPLVQATKVQLLLL